MPPVSPLRYPGGKGKLSGFFQELVKANKLENGIYVEAFAGGAAVAMGLLLDGMVRKVVINDLDRSVWAFWRALVDRTEEFVDATMRTPLTVDEWTRQREINRDPDSSVFDLGFSTFYLNRTNRSGVLKGGIIGGLDQKGKYKMDARFYRKTLVERMRLIGDRHDQIEIHNLDAEELIHRVLPHLPKDETLVFFDPPYYGKGRALYMSHYDSKDHRSLSRAIIALPHYWCVTYDDIPQAHRLYSGHRIHRFRLDYCAHTRKRGAEMMVFSSRLRKPRIVRLPS